MSLRRVVQRTKRVIVASAVRKAVTSAAARRPWRRPSGLKMLITPWIPVGLAVTTFMPVDTVSDTGMKRDVLSSLVLRTVRRGWWIFLLGAGVEGFDSWVMLIRALPSAEMKPWHWVWVRLRKILETFGSERICILLDGLIVL